MPVQYPELPQISANIVCPKCEAVGVVVWEINGEERSLVSLSRGFYERISTTSPYPIELVCHQCGTAQPED